MFHSPDFPVPALHYFPVPSQLCVLHNLSCFHAHVFISLHPLICSLSNLLILDSEHSLTLLMLQSPPCFDDACGFQLPSPMYKSDCFSSATTLSAPPGCSVSREARMTCEYQCKNPFFCHFLPGDKTNMLWIIAGSWRKVIFYCKKCTSPVFQTLVPKTFEKIPLFL